MRILQIIGTLNPAYGGIVEFVKQTSSALADLGHAIEIVTLDNPNSDFFEYKEGIIIHYLGPSFGKYRFNLRLIPWLFRNAKRFDAILVHGIWQFQSLAVWLTSRIKRFSYFVYPHGALDPWFKFAYPKKHIKKWLYWPWAEYQVLRDATGVLFTTLEESRLASKSFCLYKANSFVINFGISDPAGNFAVQKQVFIKAYPKLKNKRIILFLSRIHPKKGCDLLIQAFADLHGLDSNLHLVIAGPDEIGWKNELMRLAEKYEITESITWTGMLLGDKKWGAYLNSEVFILPSHAENFGIVIAESLAYGLPILITDKVNIWKEVLEDKAGFVEPDTYKGISSLIKKWLSLSKNEQQAMRINARNCFVNRFEINKVAQTLIETIAANKETKL